LILAAVRDIIARAIYANQCLFMDIVYEIEKRIGKKKKKKKTNKTGRALLLDKNGCKFL
jgi:hypothetical protein